jgi:hypothetical protein
MPVKERKITVTYSLKIKTVEKVEKKANEYGGKSAYIEHLIEQDNGK